jgi:hypothetical protein
MDEMQLFGFFGFIIISLVLYQNKYTKNTDISFNI